jgi:hypothetical protein
VAFLAVMVIDLHLARPAAPALMTPPTTAPGTPVSGVVCHGSHYTLTAEIHAGS